MEPPIEPAAHSDANIQPARDFSANDVAANGLAANESLLQSKMAVLAILFLGTGALGIPLLWTNKRFSTNERLVWSTITTIYSLSLLLFLGWFIYWLKTQVMG